VGSEQWRYQTCQSEFENMGSRKKQIGSEQDDTRAESVVRQLTKLRISFGRQSATRKLKLLQQLKLFVITDVTLLKNCHDLLCFIRAYPDDAAVLKVVESELQSFSLRIEQYRQLTRDHKGRKLRDTGLVGTVVEHPFSLGVTSQLLRWYSDKLSIDWDDLDEDVGGEMIAILPFLAAWQENDTFDNDDSISIDEWLSVAKGTRSRSDLETFVKLINMSGMRPDVQRYLFDNLDLTVTWQLGDSTASRTLKRLPMRKVYYQKGDRRPRASDLRAEIRKPAAQLQRLSLSQGKRYVQDINEVLASRNRELFPVTFANPSEVYLYEPGRGVQILIYGTNPEIRLPLESNFGAMLVRNGMPVGYGICATLFDCVEIAINIFPAFRSGESSYIIEQFFKLFYHHFGSQVYLVRSRQMGDGDDEPLHSGAFWFYYKLGFRAVKKRVRKLAEEEHEVIQRSSKYRSPMKTLRRLSKSDVFLHMDSDQMDNWRELSLVNLGYVVTKYAAEVYDGNRDLIVRRSVAAVISKLKVRGWKQWPKNEIVALERLAPLIAGIPELSGWSTKDKTALVRLIRAKGAVHERGFSLSCGRHVPFREALENLASRYDQQE
jgi:hypothetical protein